MRRLSLSLALLGWLTTSSITLASPAPMSEEEMLEAATLVVDGEITEVTCNGEPTQVGGGMTTPYLATLSATEVLKGEAIDDLKLPFALSDWEDGATPLCSFEPSFAPGQSGRFYLYHDAQNDLYSLVGEGGFVPDTQSAAQPLPECGQGPTDACEGVDCGECGFCEQGECLPYDGDVDLCEAHADCAEGERCDIGECGLYECVTDPNPSLTLCEATSGTWNECAHASCDDCDDCVADCDCPTSMSFDPVQGCVATIILRCEETGGEWTDCYQFPCPEGRDCPAVCEPWCICPEGEGFDMADGCHGPLSPSERCEETGGTEDCEDIDCPEGEECDLECNLVCVCPEGTQWYDGSGCVAPPSLEALCAYSGGQIDCVTDCADDDLGCQRVSDCADVCICPTGQEFSETDGCVEAADVEETVGGETPDGEGTTDPNQGDGDANAGATDDAAAGGCAGGSSPHQGVALMLTLLVALGASRRRVRLIA
jgi:hypothetical protein